MTERRRFSSTERVALYLAQDGRCAICGDPLPAGFHSDHVMPWSRGGDTDVVNGQALCPKCNLAKGAKMVTPLRAWQDRALVEYTRHERPDYLVEATPGAGKTRFASELAVRLRAADQIKRIVWVVPSHRLRKQTSDAVRRDTGLQLHYLWENGQAVFPTGKFDGAVVTYQSVASEPALYRKICGQIPTLAILDEIHHANANRAWGAALQGAFEPAVKRILLSGTPFRSDNGAIPFVNYVDGKAVADFTYGYGDALKNDVVRAVYFQKLGGLMEWLDDDGHKAATFDQDLDESGQSRRLRTALMPSGGHLVGMLKQAHASLLEMRQDDDPDAAGLVIAIDQNHARSIAQIMKAELGIEPALAISDEPAADAVVEAFASSAEPWIVAVKMVSEGVDIVRLRVGVYATNVITELFFRQAVGRIIRRDEHSTAMFYIPDDSRLRQFASEIKRQREAVLDEQDDAGARTPTPDLGGNGPIPLFVPISSTAVDAGVIADEHHFSADELAFANKVKLRNRDTASLQTIHVAMLLREIRGPGAAFEHHATPPQDETARLATLRGINERLARKIALQFGLAFRDVQTTLNKFVRIRSVPKCFDANTLERRKRAAEHWLTTGSMTGAANA